MNCKTCHGKSEQEGEFGVSPLIEIWYPNHAWTLI
jgi:hypothetical protein